MFVLWIKAHLKFSCCLLQIDLPTFVDISPRIIDIDAIQIRMDLIHAAKHLIEGMILHDEKNNSLDRIRS
jgi:hypothetical protein